MAILEQYQETLLFSVILFNLSLKKSQQPDQEKLYPLHLMDSVRMFLAYI